MACTKCNEFPCVSDPRSEKHGQGPCQEPPRQDDLALLRPDLRERHALWESGCQYHGLRVATIETGRTDERQLWLWGRGRDDVPYARPGLIVTNVHPQRSAKGSHLLVDGRCVAWDFLITHQRDAAGEVKAVADHWKRRPNAWTVAGGVATALGLTWGGAWRMLDLGHVQGHR